MRKSARKCFVCGQVMTVMVNVVLDYTPFVECKDCDVTENAAVTREKNLLSDETDDCWGGRPVKFIDHSKVYLPSPDMIGTC